LIIASYVFFLISVVPLILQPTTDACHPGKPDCPKYYGDPILLFYGYPHFVWVPIIVTLFTLGLYKQARSSSLNLSLAGLSLQAVIFMLSAASWVFRLPFPWKALIEQPYGPVPMYLVIPAWFHMIGFVAVDDAIFALGQGVLAVLLWLALRREKRLAGSDAEESHCWVVTADAWGYLCLDRKLV
jgi:hypothetical protein